MGDVVSLADRRRLRQQIRAACTGEPEAKAVRLPSGGFQMVEGATLADLMASWPAMCEEIEDYRRDIRRRGEVPFADM